MISIKYSDIPSFLHNSSFYQSLCDSSDDENIQIPEQCIVFNDEVRELTDFTNLIKVFAFWGLKRLSVSIITFCHDNAFALWSGVLLDEFAEIDFAQDLVACFDPDAWPPGIVHAIQAGRTELVEFLAGKPNASSDGHIDILQFAVAQRLLIDTATVDAAAFNGRLDCLQYLLGLGCEATATTCQKACLNGHLECLKMLHVSHVPWNISAMHAAASGGYLP
eukprot:gene15885-18146_t